MKGNDLQSRMFYLARLSFRIKGEIKFLRQEKAKRILTTKPVFKEKLKALAGVAQ